MGGRRLIPNIQQAEPHGRGPGFGGRGRMSGIGQSSYLTMVIRTFLDTTGGLNGLCSASASTS